MYKLVIAVLFAVFIVNSAMNMRHDFQNKVNARLATIDNIAK